MKSFLKLTTLAIALSTAASFAALPDRNAELKDASTQNYNLSISHFSVHATAKKNAPTATIQVTGTLETGLGGPGTVVVEKVLKNAGQVFYVVKPVETPGDGTPTIEQPNQTIPFSLTLTESNLNHDQYTFLVLNGQVGDVSTVTVSALPY